MKEKEPKDPWSDKTKKKRGILDGKSQRKRPKTISKVGNLKFQRVLSHAVIKKRRIGNPLEYVRAPKFTYCT